MGLRRACLASIVSLVVLLFASLATPAFAATKAYNFTLTYGYWSADCVKKQVILINGAYPGPTIEANEGDTIQVRVVNNLITEGVSIHWHGIRQFNTVYMDGAAYVSECPIPSLSEFTYTFLASHAGTFMYHGHHGLQSTAGLYGKLIVYEPAGVFPYTYTGELSLLLNDWFHRSIYDISAGLSSTSFVWIGDPQSVVLNGKGKYNCSLVPTQGSNVPGGTNSGDVLSCNATSDQCTREVFSVQAGKTYRLRIASVATVNLFNVKIEGHSLTVVKKDQHLVKPFVVSSLDVFSGQNVDVLFTASKKGNYWISVAIRARNTPNTPNGYAILNVGGATVSDPVTAVPVHPVWNDTTFTNTQIFSYYSLPTSLKGDAPAVPKTSTRRLVLVNTQQKYEGRIVWALNNISHALPPTPVFHAIKSGQTGLYDPIPPPDVPAYVYDYTKVPTYTECLSTDRVYFFDLNQVVDIVLQNANTLTVNTSEYHPWHLHGHHFWVVGFGNGTFNSSSDTAKFNLVDPHYVNTVPIFPYGWTAIRLKADNPGAWFFHCHILAHHYLGMSTVFAVGKKDGSDMPALPQKTRKCGYLY